MKRNINNMEKKMMVCSLCFLLTLSAAGCAGTGSRNNNGNNNIESGDTVNRTEQFTPETSAEKTPAVDTGATVESAADITTEQAAAQETVDVGTEQPIEESAANTDAAQMVSQNPPAGTEQITLDTAKENALADAGLTASEVTFTKEKLDYEDGIAVYDIEFYTAAKDYEYEINAASGVVYSKSVENFDTGLTHHQDNHHHSGNTGNSQSAGGDISEAEAKNIALNHAGFSVSDVSFSKVEYDWDDGQPEYEIEFYAGGREYEYTINASTGAILEYDID